MAATWAHRFPWQLAPHWRGDQLELSVWPAMEGSDLFGRKSSSRLRNGFPFFSSLLRMAVMAASRLLLQRRISPRLRSAYRYHRGFALQSPSAAKLTRYDRWLH